MAVTTGTTTIAYLGSTGGHVIPPYYADFMRENLYPSLYWRQLGTLVTVPRGTGFTVKIPRWQTPVKTEDFVAKVSASISAVITAAEGNIIAAATLCANSITGTFKQFAGARGYSDKLILVTRANFIEGALESLVRELAFDIDKFSRLNLCASRKTRFLSAGQSKAFAGSTLVGKNVARIAPYMDSFNVPRWEDETFVGITHPLAQFDIFSDPSATGFVSVARYGERQKIYKGELGQMYGIRWLISNSLPRIFGATATSATSGFANAVSGCNTYIFGPDAFYSLEIEDGGVEVIHHPPGSGGSTGDPANQFGTVAVKVYYGVAATTSAESRLVRIPTAITLR